MILGLRVMMTLRLHSWAIVSPAISPFYIRRATTIYYYPTLLLISYLLYLYHTNTLSLYLLLLDLSYVSVSFKLVLVTILENMGQEEC